MYSRRSSSCPTSVNTLQGDDDEGGVGDDEVDFTNFDSVFTYGLSAVTGDIPSKNDVYMLMYVNAVRELTSDLNGFDSKNSNCAVCVAAVGICSMIAWS